LKAKKCVSVIHSKQNYQLGKLYQKHYKSLFSIIVIYHYLSLVSQLSVNYVRYLSVTACCYAKQDFFTFCAIPITTRLFPFPLVAQKLFSLPWDSYTMRIQFAQQT